MILNELFQNYPDEMQDKSNDDSKLEFTDSRKTKLTLAQINRLRRMDDMRALEQQKEIAFVKKMYAPPPAAPEMSL